MIPSLCIRQLRGPYSLLLKLGIHKEEPFKEEPFKEKRAWSTLGGGGGLVAKLCLTLGTPWTLACHAPLSMGFPRQEYWIVLPFPSPGDLPEPRIEPRSPALQTDSLKTDWTTRRFPLPAFYPSRPLTCQVRACGNGLYLSHSTWQRRNSDLALSLWSRLLYRCAVLMA